MTKRKIILFGVIIVLVSGLIIAWLWQPVTKPVAPPSPSPTAAPRPAFMPPPPVPVPDPGGPLSIKAMSRDTATSIYVQRTTADPQYDWKRPLNFYGKVVDENNQPVAEAKVHFDWNTTWMPFYGGTLSSETSSDGAGLFSLTGKHGKVLEVQVQKEGYYSVDRGGAGVPFEFANPSEPWWYEADPNHPVIFHLLKKGEGTTLISKNVEIPNHGHNAQAQINLMRGRIGPGGTLTVTYDTSKFLPGAQPFPWTFSLKMSEGGLVETNDQFPFMAPAVDYAPAITIDITNMDRSVWEDGVSKTYYFYLPSTNTYGRMTVEASASLAIELNYVYNPTHGSRYLEPASK